MPQKSSPALLGSEITSEPAGAIIELDTLDSLSEEPETPSWSSSPADSSSAQLLDVRDQNSIDIEAQNQDKAFENGHNSELRHTWKDWRVMLSPGVQLYLLSLLIGVVMKASSKWLMDESVSAEVAIQVRMAVTFLLTIVVMRLQRSSYSFAGPPGMRKMMFLRGTLGFFNIACAYYSFQYLSLPDFSMIGFVTPVLTGIAGRIFLGERFTWQQMAYGLIAFLGVILIAKPTFIFRHHENFDSHRGLAVLAALASTIGTVIVFLILRKMGETVSPISTVSNYAFCSTIGSTSLMLVRGSASVMYPQSAIAWVLLITAGVAGALLNYLVPKALQLEEASLLTVFSPVEIVASTIFEVIIWHDLPDVWSVLGGIVVVWSVMYAATYNRTTAQRSAS